MNMYIPLYRFIYLFPTISNIKSQEFPEIGIEILGHRGLNLMLVEYSKYLNCFRYILELAHSSKTSNMMIINTYVYSHLIYKNN